MNLLILIGFAVFGYWIVSKLIPSKGSKSPARVNSPLSRPWFEVLDLPRDASDAEIENRYQELIRMYTDEAIAALEPELRDEARGCRNEIEAAYHFSRFRMRR